MEPTLSFADTPQTRAIRLGAEVQKAKREEAEMQLKQVRLSDAARVKEINALRDMVLAAKLASQRHEATAANLRKDNERLREWMVVDTHYTFRVPRLSQFNYRSATGCVRRAVFDLFYLLRELIWPQETPADVSTDR